MQVIIFIAIFIAVCYLFYKLCYFVGGGNAFFGFDALLVGFAVGIFPAIIVGFIYSVTSGFVVLLLFIIGSVVYAIFKGNAEKGAYYDKISRDAERYREELHNRHNK
ncbi:MAG: hypothetical protein FWG64_02970 [Firmicutes bacterium]|nr:hypothetical protein [Bacillota bacterium]